MLMPITVWRCGWSALLSYQLGEGCCWQSDLGGPGYHGQVRALINRHGLPFYNLMSRMISVLPKGGMQKQSSQ